ncbi:ArsR family transcriptional regulator [Microbacterium sp. QXD-8]|uniref:ArsR family transcriptional regulator n=1 Tax=Microbacterium psychrotolerans TaxID=3068321 RepID=A0ABU0YYA0_9MICO|nr:ArsR family transcriptional regulator [Microbacterium sp. QXD-8]MDQ7876521.1 ArsR family transcriptional regulator [Microbacterium sp. QXD-8]
MTRHELTDDRVEDPADVAAALGVSAVRIDILRALREGPATISGVAAAVGYTRFGVREHLNMLERIGAVGYEIQRVPGSFRPARLYRIDADRVEAIAWSLFDAITEHTWE